MIVEVFDDLMAQGWLKAKARRPSQSWSPEGPLEIGTQRAPKTFDFEINSWGQCNPPGEVQGHSPTPTAKPCPREKVKRSTFSKYCGKRFQILFCTNSSSCQVHLRTMKGRAARIRAEGRIWENLTAKSSPMSNSTKTAWIWIGQLLPKIKSFMIKIIKSHLVSIKLKVVFGHCDLAIVWLCLKQWMFGISPLSFCDLPQSGGRENSANLQAPRHSKFWAPKWPDYCRIYTAELIFTYHRHHHDTDFIPSL